MSPVFDGVKIVSVPPPVMNNQGVKYSLPTRMNVFIAPIIPCREKHRGIGTIEKQWFDFLFPTVWYSYGSICACYDQTSIRQQANHY
jgi:hypothetical protein